MQSDAELVKAVYDGERAAFTVLMERYEPLVRSAAMEVLGDHHAAQDAAQDAFVAAYEKLGTLRNPVVFGSWILKIARRQAIRLSRSRLKTVPLDVQEAPVRVSSNGQLNPDSQRLLAAVMKLPKHERQVVMLKFFAAHSVQAIGEITGRSVGTVTKQLTRAYRRLRSRLKE